LEVLVVMSKRIILVDSSGDVLFSGVSIAQIAEAARAPEDRCPETKRSANSESGLFPAAPRVKRSSAPLCLDAPVEDFMSLVPQETPEPPPTQASYDLDEGPETRRAERAA
jgi:hypothetical protein